MRFYTCKCGKSFSREGKGNHKFCDECKKRPPRKCATRGCDNLVEKSGPGNHQFCSFCKEERVMEKFDEATDAINRLKRYLREGRHARYDTCIKDAKDILFRVTPLLNLATEYVSPNAFGLKSGKRTDDHVGGRTRLAREYLEGVISGTIEHTPQIFIDYLKKYNVTIQITSKENTALKEFGGGLKFYKEVDIDRLYNKATEQYETIEEVIAKHSHLA